MSVMTDATETTDASGTMTGDMDGSATTGGIHTAVTGDTRHGEGMTVQRGIGE